MRKLKLQMQISLDGFNSTGPNDEQKWVSWAWDEIKQDVHDLANSCDTELIGRKLAVDYIPFWTDTLTQPESMMYETAKIKAGQKKIVFTKTLDKSVWENTELAKGNLADEVNKLKSQIKALNNRLEEGKAKNIYSLQNKIKSLKMQLNIEMERYAWENYLSK
jgi:hypothetical protein